MKIIDALKHGFALVNHHRKMVGIVYIINAGSAALFAIPLFILFQNKVGKLVVRDSLASTFSYSWWSSLG